MTGIFTKMCNWLRNTSLVGVTKLMVLVTLVRLSSEDGGPGPSSHYTGRDVDERDTYLRVTTVVMEPYVMIKPDMRNVTGHHRQRYEGYIVDLLDEIMRLIGLKYRLIPVPDGHYGNRHKDGTWDGTIGELVNRNADLAAAPLYITQARSNVVDFTRPFRRVQATILLKRPPTGKPAPISSVVELTRQSHIKYGTQETGPIRAAFRSSNVTTVYPRMWRKMDSADPPVLTKSNEEGIDRVRKSNGRYAYILPTTIGDYIARRNPCDLIMVDNFLMNKGFGLATPKTSGLLSRLNKTLDFLETRGFLKMIYEKWWIKNGDCNGIHSSKIYSLTSGSRRGSSGCCYHVVFSIGLSLTMALAMS